MRIDIDRTDNFTKAVQEMGFFIVFASCYKNREYSLNDLIKFHFSTTCGTITPPVIPRFED